MVLWKNINIVNFVKKIIHFGFVKKMFTFWFYKKKFKFCFFWRKNFCFLMKIFIVCFCEEIKNTILLGYLYKASLSKFKLLSNNYKMINMHTYFWEIREFNVLLLLFKWVIWASRCLHTQNKFKNIYFELKIYVIKYIYLYFLWLSKIFNPLAQSLLN